MSADTAMQPQVHQRWLWDRLFIILCGVYTTPPHAFDTLINSDEYRRHKEPQR